MKTFCLWLAIFMAAAGTGRAETVVWSDNFETNATSHWSVNGVWHITAPTAGPATNSAGYRTYSGSHCGTTQNYATLVDSSLICTNYNGSTTFLVPATNQFPRLRFWHWFNLSYAIGYVEITTNNGSSWIQISPNYTYSSSPSGDFTSSGVWSRPYLDLSSFAGMHVQFGFRFEGGTSPNGLGWYVDDVAVVTGTPVYTEPESFESGEGDWSVDQGTWEVGVPTSGPNAAHSGFNCAATVLAGNYAGYANSRLVSPPFTISTNSIPTLTFWQWYNLTVAEAVVEITTNNGNSWYPISPTWGPNAVSGGWLQTSIDLTPYVGQRVAIGFYFGAEATGAAAGWYIDDISFPQYIPPMVEVTAVSTAMFPGEDDQFTISRSGGGWSGALTVNLAASGTAVAGTDYTNLPTSVTLPAGVYSTSLDVALSPSLTNITAAKTIVLGLVTNQYYTSGLYTNAVITVYPYRSLTNSVPSPVGRYWRGSGSDPTFWSQVVPVEGETGTVYSNLNGNCSTLYPGLSAWSSQTLYHFNATNALNPAIPTNGIAFNNPIVAFGERTGGTPLYLNQPYGFGVYAGAPLNYQTQIVVQVYFRTNLQLAGRIIVPIPVYTNNAAMDKYATNGFAITTNAFGLTTTLSDTPDLNWGNFGSGAFLLTHLASSQATNYYYVVGDSGAVDFGTYPMAITAGGAATPSLLYSLEFESRPPWRAVFLDAPQFNASPLPPYYAGKTLAEMLTNTLPVTNLVSFTPSAATNLDDSPELRRHPILDSFVASMGNDPIALANYVINQIDLTDPMDFSDNGNLSEQSINPGGVSRGALGTFMEKEGSPADQCALLVYLLRQAGVPAVYEFAPRNGLKMLDARLSGILKFQVHGAFSEAGQLYTTNTMIPVNYPWVAAYIGTNWVHIFPWLKDYGITEGFNLYDYMPTNYASAYPWLRDYILGNTNLLALATNGDNTPRVILPAYLKQTLLQNHPGVSVDDLGVQIQNRQHYYARWQDFPTPTWVTNVSTALESLTDPNLASVSPTLTNIFDTVSVEVYSVNDPAEDIQTGDLPLVLLHNREFYINQTFTNSSTMQLNLILMPFRTNITTQAAFSNDPTLLSKEVLTLNLVSTDDQLNVRFRYHRHRAITPAYPIDIYDPFMGLEASEEIDVERPLRKGDQAAICLDYGQVTPEMLNVHAANLLQMENALKLNPSATNSLSPDVYMGETMYLAGMSYYEKVSEFVQFSENLHKVRVLSLMAMGLSKIIPARNSSGTLTNGYDPVLPCVDMFFENLAQVGNGSVQLNSGQMAEAALQNNFLMSICDGSAEEHQVVNRFYQQTNTVSTVRLLQLAQSSGAGTVTLTANNYATWGATAYQGQLLENWDQQLWSQVTGYLQASPYTFAYMTPGPISNPSYTGMGAFVLGWGSCSALISPNSLNGAFGQALLPGTMSAVNAPAFNLVNNSDPTISLNQPASGAMLASTEVPTWDAQTAFKQLVNGSVVVDSFDSTAWSIAGSSLGVAFTGSVNQTDANVLQTILQSGNLNASDNAGNSLYDRVVDPVHSVTGEFYADETDLQLPGPLPLAMRRNYSSQDLADNQFGAGWKLSIMPYLSVAVGATNIYAADMDGAVLAYVRVNPTTNVWMPTVAANPTFDNNSTAGPGGLANRMRDRIVQTVNGATTNYTLYGADGSTRNFQVMTFNNGILTNSRPFLLQWTDSRGNFYTFAYGTNATGLDFGQMNRIQSSNGNYLGFDFDTYGHIIDAYTGDGRWVYYQFDQYGDLVNVTLPDETERSYVYQHGTQAVTNGTAIYSTHLIVEEDKPDGRVLQNAYDSQRRVTNQWSTAGLTLTPIRTATFIYSNNFVLTNSFTNTITGHTWIVDGNNQTNRFDYTNGLITQITDPLGQTIQQIWFTTNTTATGYYPRSVATRIDKRGLVTQFQYDSNGNVTNTIVTGDLLGDGITSETATNTALYNSNSLPVQMTDPAGNSVVIVYDPVFTFLPQQVVRFSGGTAVSTNLTVYGDATNIVVNGSITQTNCAFGLATRQIRASGSVDAATNDLVYNGNGFLTESIRYTGTTDPNVTNTFFYNERGQMVNRVDALGAVTFFDYDALDRPTEQENFDEFGNALAWTFNYYNENGELNWTEGPRYNPENYVYYDYDGEGRRSTEIHWRSQANSDGSGVSAPSGYNLYAQTFYQYDPLGNLTFTIDPRGAITTNTYDAISRLVQSKHLDLDGVTVLSTDGYGYEPGGQVRYHTNALGGVTTTLYTTTGKPEYRGNPDNSTNAWRYYLDGRIRREIQGNGAYWQTTYDDVNRITTRVFYSAAGLSEATNSVQLDRRGNAILRVDAGNNMFTTAFDGLDRAKISAGPAITNVISQTSGMIPGGPLTYITNVLEQSITSYFDAAGRAVTNINSLGEVTITTMDALGRTTSTLINSASGALVREKYFAYSADHNSVTVTDGSGANAISHTTYTDTGGNPVLSIAYPATGTLDYKRMVYDLAGNLAYEEHDTTPGNVWTFAGYAHDGLNSLTFETNRDDAVTAYVHDPLGDVTNRVMPGGLQWDAIYNHAGQVQQDWLVGTGNVGTRTNTYTYFASGTPFAGLLNTMTDGRGLVSTYGYDDRLRQTSISRTDSNYGQVNTAWSYDARGYATNITEQYTTNDLGNYNPKVITRAFDPYGQLSSETVSVGGSGFSSASQNWDAAGRRTGLSINDAVYGFSSRADGALIYASDPTGSGSYAYDTAGVLTNRAVGSRTTSITARDGEGRPSTIATAINGASLMTETLGWNGDGTLNADTLYRPDFTDSRIYTYASLTRRLTQEQINLNASTTWTNSFAYDGGTASGPGVLTQMGVPGSSSVNWTGGESPFSSVNAETNTCITYSANGWVNGDSALQAFLDGRSQAIFTNALGNSTNLNAFQWHANMELTPGAHQLKVAALHPSGFYTAWATNSFTNGIAGQTDALTRDAGGNITLRVWLKPNGTTNHQQQLSWDAKNRLTDLIDVDSTQTGYHWHAEYDALDRRLFTSCTVYTNGQDPNLSPVIIDQFYDPMVEFLELGVAYGDQSIFKLYGPDMNGRYGGLNGTGGFDGFSSYLNTFTPVISDFRGNILAEVTNNYFVAWTPARPTGFGAVPGYRPSALGHGADISLASAWRGRWVDISGYYNLGKRVYDPVAGMWLSYDPSWNDADPNYLSFAGGDPINRFDGDGRCALYAGEKALTGIAQFFASASNEEDARPIDEIYQEQYDANYKYYGNNAWYAMNATYNPAVGTELAASEMINGQGLNYYNSGQTLTDNQRVDAAFNFGSGTAATVGTAALLEGAGALSVNAVSSYLAPSLDDSLPSTFNVAGSQNAGNAGTPPPMGTVYVSPPPDATPAQIQQVQAYATGANEAIQQGLLMNGRVSTAGALRQAASRAAATERSSAAAAGTPYQGQVGHVPDTTWTGTPQPYSWLDLDPAVNASIGGQANGYPLGFVPTDFQPSN